MVGADAGMAERAATLAKADLVTEMVGEFPELQGLMGRYYATAQGEYASVAAACEEHYKPQGPSDRVPSDPVSIAVALADKIDTLVGFWAIDEKPTGSKDPYALRRAALGVIRLILENGLRLPLVQVIDGAQLHVWFDAKTPIRENAELQALILANVHLSEAGVERKTAILQMFKDEIRRGDVEHSLDPNPMETFLRNEVPIMFRKNALDLLTFFIDRLKVYLRDRGARYDLIDAALGAVAAPSSDPASPGHLLPQVGEGIFLAQDDLVMITTKVEALSKFLDTDDGKNLLAGFRRAVNILKIEEKKDGAGAYDQHHAPNLRIEPQEHRLAAAIARAREETHEKLHKEDYAGAMHMLAKLREPVDAFFEHVTVNADNKDLRLNRLRLLNELRVAMLGVADFGKVAGDGGTV